MSDKPKVLLAVGERALETVLKSELSHEFTFVKEASYREIVISRIRDEQAEIVLLREALRGSMPIENLVYDIRESFPDVRIVFYTRKYRPGEPLLRKLVSYGVYDFIAGESVTKAQIFDGLRTPKQLSDVRQYLEAPSIEGSHVPVAPKREYKDYSEPEAEVELPELKTPPAVENARKSKVETETQAEKKQAEEKNGLFGKLFGRNKKKEAKKKVSLSKAEQPEPFRIEVDENEEEERAFGNATPDKEVNPASEVDVVLGASTEPSTERRHPMLNFSTSAQTPAEEGAIPKSNSMNEAPYDASALKEEGSKFSPEQRHRKPTVSESVVHDLDHGEEDLFGGGATPRVSTPKVKTPNEETNTQTTMEAEPTIEKPKLKIPTRGKPNQSPHDEVALHRQEPEIDFNPLEVDAANPAPIQKSPIEHRVPKPAPHTPIEHNEEGSEGWSGRNSPGAIRVNQKQIVTFVGATHGVGNTHVAYNTAVKLAEEGNNVLFMECHSVFSSVDFSLQIGSWQQGIEKALEDVEYNQGGNVSEHIIRMRKKKMEVRKDKALKKMYKPLPDTLDFMFYSQDYQTLEDQHYVPKERLKDLVMYLLMQEDYDVIVVDSEPIGQPGVDGLLNISSKVYITMTQDPAQMGVFHRQFDATQKRINVSKNRYIVVNQFVKTEPTVNRIQKWTNERVLQTVPFTHKDVVTANYLGMPFILRTKHQSAINAFDSLIEHIAE